MKGLRTIVFVLSLLATAFATAQTRGVANNPIPGDNIMRYYRLALPVTVSAFEEDFGSDYNKVLQFWQECEEFANRMFVPLGVCFDVVEDSRLVMQERNLIDESIYNIGFGTELTDAAIGTANYDVGMWVHHRDEDAENSGLTQADGVYNPEKRATDMQRPTNGLWHMSLDIYSVLMPIPHRVKAVLWIMRANFSLIRRYCSYVMSW